jgi:eukaryotic-like serine/threonine-protein kinase
MLDGERLERLGELFERVATLPPGERAAFLRRECGADRELHAELSSLLASHVTEPAYLERLGSRVMPAVLENWLGEEPYADDPAGRYELMERIGAGGMGVVYKARDRVLDRVVALKFLPRHLAGDDAARAALTREARAVSALDHPNIAVVYDVAAMGDAASLCIAMAHYDGETLQSRIERGPVAADDAVAIAQQLAHGLAAAHGAGIVHRDMKPANALITPAGQVRIVDFGMARITTSDPATEVDVAGTAAYMSPEQTRGGAVDHRSDLWSFGVILYEMLAGVRPFQGADVKAVISSIRDDDPPPLTQLRPDLPEALTAIVHRCLEKDVARRYASAQNLIAELQSCNPTAQGEPSILVLPFANISADPESDYFSDGLTEEIIADLSRIRALRVISRTSAMRYRRSRTDLKTMAREVGVRYVLEGGVRKAGSDIRITVRFVDARTDRLIWSRKFAGTVQDVFAMQESVAHAIADALRIRLSAPEATELARRPIQDARAYEAYLRARYEAWSFSREALERARRHIEAALAIVGDNELLYGTLGHIMAGHLEAGIDPEGVLRDKVDELADRAFALNPDSARGHFLKAFVAYHRADMAVAIRAGQRAHYLAPYDPDTLLLLGYVYAHVGRNDDARALFDRALELDPLTPLTHAVQGFLAVVEGRFTDAVAHYRRGRDLDPDSAFAAVCYGWSLVYAGFADEALLILDAAAARFPHTPFEAWARALSSALRNDPAGVLQAITPMMEAAATGSEMFARALAQACALGGHPDLALHWLEKEIDLGMLNHAFLSRHDHMLDPLRGMPAFEALLVRVQERQRLFAAAEL